MLGVGWVQSGSNMTCSNLHSTLIFANPNSSRVVGMAMEINLQKKRISVLIWTFHSIPRKIHCFWKLTPRKVGLHDVPIRRLLHKVRRNFLEHPILVQKRPKCAFVYVHSRLKTLSVSKPLWSF